MVDMWRSDKRGKAHKKLCFKVFGQTSYQEGRGL